MQKILAVVLAAVMMLGMSNMAVFAEGTDKAAVTLTKGNVTKDYDSVAAAVAAVQDGETATITLNQNFTGPGIIVGKGNIIQNITIDLNRHTWEITNPTVGSTGTETNGMQLLKGNTVYLKNGVITSKAAKLLIQNYCNLTIDNVKLSGADNLTQLIVSNNNGKTIIKGNSKITAAKNGKAFDADKWGSYDGGDVYLEDGTINGDINATNGGKVTVFSGEVNGNIVAYNYKYCGFENQTPIISVSGGTIHGDIQAEDNGSIKIEDGIVKGSVKVEGTKANISISGGAFSTKPDDSFIDSSKVVVKYTKSKADDVYYIGTEEKIQEILVNVKSGDSVEVYQGDLELKNMPEGVTVGNKGNGEVKVNNQTVSKGQDFTVAAATETKKPAVKQPTYKQTSTRKIKVSWWRKKAADGFVIYAKAGKGKYKKIKTVGKKKSTTVTVKAGYSYKFKVKAYKNVKKNGKTVRKYWKAYKAMGKNGKKNVKITYKNISGYRGYVIYMKVGKGSYKKVKTTTKGGTITYTKTKAKVGKSYKFKLKGYKIVKGKKVYTTIKAKKA